jgi:uncharacterized coiled-coil protein SlyX
MDYNFIKAVLEFIGLLCIPVIAWMLTAVNTHGRKIIVLEERVNDSLNRRLNNLESKFEGFEEKLEEISINAVKTSSTVSQLDVKLDLVLSQVNLGKRHD